MVIHLLGGAADVKYILLSQVDVLIEEEGGKMPLKISAVLHHHSIGYCVTPVKGMGLSDGSVQSTGRPVTDQLEQEYCAVTGILGNG